jgi:membrane-associated phospholipid phosphatase
MAAADRVLFLGRDPLDLLEGLISRPLSEWLAFAYSFYAVLYPLVFGAVFLFHGNETVRRATTPVGLALLGSYVSYSLIPVKGPLLSRTFTVSLDLYIIGPLKEAMMDVTRITFDCFPSMHTACTMIMAYLAWRYVRRLFWWIVPVVVSMPLACVYLRYHYVVDVLAGLAVAAVVIAVDRRIPVASGTDVVEEPEPARAAG